MSTFHARSCRGYREKRWTDGRTHTHIYRPTAITLRCACAQARVNNNDVIHESTAIGRREGEREESGRVGERERVREEREEKGRE